MIYFKKIWSRVPSFTDKMVDYGLANKKKFKTSVWSSGAGQIELIKGSSFIRGVSDSGKFVVEIGKRHLIRNRETGCENVRYYDKSKLILNKKTKEGMYFENKQITLINKENFNKLALWMEKKIEKELKEERKRKLEFERKQKLSIHSLKGEDYKILDKEEYGNGTNYDGKFIKHSDILMKVASSSGELEITFFEEEDLIKMGDPYVSVSFRFNHNRLFQFRYYILTKNYVVESYYDKELLNESVEDVVQFIRDLFKKEEVKVLPTVEMIEKRRELNMQGGIKVFFGGKKMEVEKWN